MMTLASDQALSISAPAGLDPRARSSTAWHDDDRGGRNAQIADALRQIADILTPQGADPFRIAAYLRAA